MHDIVIRGGSIIDGSGAPAFTGDVAIAQGRIVAVGGKQGPARRDIDADGLLVTPGWVDVHTHYDGQAMWDPLLAPSCWHGVTTVMFGNCGVGFAPVKKEHRGALMDLMASRRSPIRCWPPASTGNGKRSRNTWMSSSGGRARSMSRRRLRICRCASTSWATARCGARRRRRMT